MRTLEEIGDDLSRALLLRPVDRSGTIQDALAAAERRGIERRIEELQRVTKEQKKRVEYHLTSYPSTVLEHLRLRLDALKEDKQ